MPLDTIPASEGCCTGREAALPDPPARPCSEEWLNELAAAASNGERGAVEQLIICVRPLIVRYCRARIGRAAGGFEAADDVAQEACMGVVAALPGYYGKDYPILALAYRITANKVADHYRKHAMNRSVSVEQPPERGDPGPTPVDALLDKELSERLRMLLGVLARREREILTLRLVVGMSAEETAQVIGSTCGAVRVAQHRALAKLRSILAVPEEPAV